MNRIVVLVRCWRIGVEWTCVAIGQINADHEIKAALGRSGDERATAESSTDRTLHFAREFKSPKHIGCTSVCLREPDRRFAQVFNFRCDECSMAIPADMCSCKGVREAHEYGGPQRLRSATNALVRPLGIFHLKLTGKAERLCNKSGRQ